jgi:hypothetical protein
MKLWRDITEGRSWLRREVIGGEDGGLPLMVRYHLTPATRVGQIVLHVFQRPDQDRHLHDHPFHFLSLCLWGGYIEEVTADPGRPDQPRMRPHRPGRLRFIHARLTHRVVYLMKRTSVTLVWRSPQVRNWGFRVGPRWVHHKAYRVLAQMGFPGLPEMDARVSQARQLMSVMGE